MVTAMESSVSMKSASLTRRTEVPAEARTGRSLPVSGTTARMRNPGARQLHPYRIDSFRLLGHDRRITRICRRAAREARMDLGLHGLRALVTGGTRGIGRAIVGLVLLSVSRAPNWDDLQTGSRFCCTGA